MNKLPILAVNVDGVIRNFNESFDKQYRKVFIYNPSLVAMDEGSFTMREQTSQELQEQDDMIKQREKELITLPMNSPDLLNHYKFEGKTIEMNDEIKLLHPDENQADMILSPQQCLDKFLQDDYPFQVYGNAEEYQGAMDAINKIQYVGLTNNLFETVLVSTVKSKAIPATYFFLSKFNCRVKKIVFLNNDDEKWELAQAVVDALPVVLQNKPDNKTSIKINHPYNQWDQADFSYDSLKQMANDKRVFELIFKNKDK